MDNDNRANQLNPNNDAFWQSRGEAERPFNWIDLLMDLVSLLQAVSQPSLDNRSNQLNPNNPVYYSSRGLTKP